MPQKIILFSGSSAVGKTSVLRTLLPYVRQKGYRPIVCKIDCLHSDDEAIYRQAGIPAVTGLSQDICPDLPSGRTGGLWRGIPGGLAALAA